MYKWTKKTPKKIGFYWLNILKKDKTSKKGFPKVVEIQIDERLEIGGGCKIPKGTLLASGYWSSSNPAYDNYLWSSKPIEKPI